MRLGRLWLVLLAGVPLSALAWNDGGHMVVAELAWRALGPAERVEVSAVLQQHPHYLSLLVAEVSAGVDSNEWAFLRASTWPDMVRPARPGDPAKAKEVTAYNRPEWPYIDQPFVAEADRGRVDAGKVKPKATNIVERLWATEERLRSDIPPPERAVALNRGASKSKFLSIISAERPGISFPHDIDTKNIMAVQNGSAYVLINHQRGQNKGFSLGAGTVLTKRADGRWDVMFGRLICEGKGDEILVGTTQDGVYWLPSQTGGGEGGKSPPYRHASIDERYGRIFLTKGEVYLYTTSEGGRTRIQLAFDPHTVLVNPKLSEIGLIRGDGEAKWGAVRIVNSAMFNLSASEKVRRGNRREAQVVSLDYAQPSPSEIFRTVLQKVPAPEGKAMVRTTIPISGKYNRVTKSYDLPTQNHHRFNNKDSGSREHITVVDRGKGYHAETITRTLKRILPRYDPEQRMFVPVRQFTEIVTDMNGQILSYRNDITPLGCDLEPLGPPRPVVSQTLDPDVKLLWGLITMKESTLINVGMTAGAVGAFVLAMPALVFAGGALPFALAVGCLIAAPMAVDGAFKDIERTGEYGLRTYLFPLAFIPAVGAVRWMAASASARVAGKSLNRGASKSKFLSISNRAQSPG